MKKSHQSFNTKYLKNKFTAEAELEKGLWVMRQKHVCSYVQGTNTETITTR